MRLLLLLLLLLAAPAAAQEAGKAAQLQAIAERGRLLYEVDRAGWVATDDLRERLGGKETLPARGWVVERDGDLPHAFVVTFYDDGRSGPRAVYSGKVRVNRVVSGALLPERPPLTPAQRRLAEAVQLAGKAGFRSCAAAGFNPAAIPPASADAPIDVYLLTPMVKNGVYPFGGHYLVRIGADGREISKRAFTNTCIPMDVSSKEGQDMVAFGVTHLLDPVPTEIHVFLSLWSGKEVGVAAGDRLWWISGERITDEGAIP